MKVNRLERILNFMTKYELAAMRRDQLAWVLAEVGVDWEMDAKFLHCDDFSLDRNPDCL